MSGNLHRLLNPLSSTHCHPLVDSSEAQRNLDIQTDTTLRDLKILTPALCKRALRLYPLHLLPFPRLLSAAEPIHSRIKMESWHIKIKSSKYPATDWRPIILTIINNTFFTICKDLRPLLCLNRVFSQSSLTWSWKRITSKKPMMTI